MTVATLRWDACQQRLDEIRRLVVTHATATTVSTVVSFMMALLGDGSEWVASMIGACLECCERLIGEGVGRKAFSEGLLMNRSHIALHTTSSS